MFNSRAPLNHSPKVGIASGDKSVYCFLLFLVCQGSHYPLGFLLFSRHCACGVPMYVVVNAICQWFLSNAMAWWLYAGAANSGPLSTPPTSPDEEVATLPASHSPLDHFLILRNNLHGCSNDLTSRWAYYPTSRTGKSR